MTEEQDERQPGYADWGKHEGKKTCSRKFKDIIFMFIYENKLLDAAIRRHLCVCSSVVMEPHNSIISNSNLPDD